jgi:hypothetical protein
MKKCCRFRVLARHASFGSGRLATGLLVTLGLPVTEQATAGIREPAGRRARCVPDPTVNWGDSRSLTEKRARRRPASALVSDPAPGAFQAGHAGSPLLPAGLLLAQEEAPAAKACFC